MLCCAMLCHVNTLCYATSAINSARLCYAMFCYALPFRTMPCHAMLCFALLCHSMLCNAMLCFLMLFHAVLCYAMPFLAMSYYALLCYEILLCQDAMLFYATLYTKLVMKCFILLFYVMPCCPVVF